MIKIRDPNLDLLAVIENVLNTTIKEAINREFFLSFTTVDDGEKSQYVVPDNVVELDDNYFVIVRLQRKMSQKGELMINVDCEHVNMYELNKPEYNVEYFTVDGTPTEILTQILAGTGFTVGTVEFTATETYSLQEPATRRGLLIQFAEYVGGELKFDKYTVHLLQRRGADNGVQFRVGKNLRGITVDMDKRSGTLQTAFDVDVIELSQLPEYGDLEKFELGDTVRIIAPDLGIDEEQRIIEYEYDPVLRMNSRVTIANFIEGLEDNITRIQRTTVVKERLYNGIRIGPKNGFEAIRSDNKARTVMNATEGITIQKGDGSGSSWSDVFYADLNGNLVLTGRIEAGEFVGGTIDIGNGAFSVDNTGNVTITTGSIDLGGGVFTVDNDGNMTATGATLQQVTITNDLSGLGSVTINDQGVVVNNGTVDTVKVDLDGNAVFTSVTIQTAETGRRIVLEGSQLQSLDLDTQDGFTLDGSEGDLKWYTNGVVTGGIYLDSSQFYDQFVFSHDNAVLLASDLVEIAANTVSLGNVGGTVEVVADVIFYGNVDFSSATVQGLTFSDSGTTSPGGDDGHTHTFSVSGDVT